MAVLEGKSPSERNKLIAAIVLGALALIALFMAFGPSIGGSSTSVSVTVSPTPRSASANRELGPVTMPSKAEQDLGYMVPVVYSPGAFGDNGSGRNIFAFYEPPRPCPECPTPLPPTPKPYVPTPTPPLPFEIAGASPGSIFAGSKGFRLEVAGDRFTPDARIIFDNVELPTTFINAQRLAANVPAGMISTQGQRAITVRTPDGKGYSLVTYMSVQPPPQPAFQYIGMISRTHGNNDTAYLSEQGKQTPTGYRLNDVVAGRFRVVNISAERLVVEDTNLGFRHSVALSRPAPGSTTTAPSGPGGFPNRSGMPPGFPTNPQIPAQGIPGIPGNIPVYRPPNRNTNTQKSEDDDEDDEDTEKP